MQVTGGCHMPPVLRLLAGIICLWQFADPDAIFALGFRQ
jgi:hypothetical protein